MNWQYRLLHVRNVVSPFLVGLLCYLHASNAKAEQYTLSTFELAPYVGEELQQNGVLAEIVKAAFNASGNEAQIQFFPAKRALANVKSGKAIAVFPISQDSTMADEFILSSAISSMTPGLLTRKNAVTESRIRQTNKTIGLKAGSLPARFKNTYAYASFHETHSNERLLEMLYHQRLDYVLIDKFTASDLMVSRLPNLIGQLAFVKESLFPIHFHVGFAKDTDEGQKAHNRFQTGLETIQRNGVLNQLLHKHGLLSFAAKKDQKILRIATVKNREMQTMQRLSAVFEQQNPGIKLDWRIMDESTLRLRLLSDLAISDGQFDIMTIGSYETPIWAKKGWLRAIKNLPEHYRQSDLISNVSKSLSYQNQLFALPFYGESSLTFYRKDLFAKANLSMPEKPTWKQILDFAQKLHDIEDNVHGICLRGKAGWGEAMALLTTMVNAHGGQWFNMDWEPQINTPQWHDAVNLYVQLVSQFGPPEPEKNGYTQLLAQFSKGHCGIWVDASVAAATLFDSSKSTVADSVDYTSAPMAVTDRGSNWLWIWSLAIPASSDLPEDAQKFITWATSKAYIELVSEKEGWSAVPSGTRYSTYQNEQYTQAFPIAKFILNAIESSSPDKPTLPNSPYTGLQYVAIEEFPAIGTYVNKNINAVIAGKMTVTQALEDAQQFAKKQMRSAGYYRTKAKR